jgi:HEAT repeat protein
MLGVAVFVLTPGGSAESFWQSAPKENVLEALLSLPAPPPPNPLMPLRLRDEKFYDRKNPPPDNAPIDDLIDYWTHQAGDYRGSLIYVPRPSDKTLERLLAETDRDPSLIGRLIRALPEDKLVADRVKKIYDRMSSDRNFGREERNALREWLKLHSPYFTGDLQRGASAVRDSDGYVNNAAEDAFLALARHDFDVARPTIEKLYLDNSQPASQALATWALYRHALDTDAIGDVDRYREELKRMVEDRSNPDGMRDMANDALARERDFPGRDEWFYSLLEDDSLVDMKRYSMLTTLVMYQPPDKYVAKMIELLASNNKVVRSAAARNLLVAYSRSPDPEIIKALVPWLEDPKWLDRKGDDWVYGGSVGVGDGEGPRRMIVGALQSFRMPESVPGLIAVLDERATRTVPDYSVYAANAVANTTRPPSTVANTVVNVAPAQKQESYYPFRDAAIRALGKQKDPRAAPALRRLLNQVAPYQRMDLINAMIACDAFTVQEELDALESIAKRIAAINEDATSSDNSNLYQRFYGELWSSMYAGSTANFQPGTPVKQDDLRTLIGMSLLGISEPSDALVRTTIDRIEMLDEKDPPLATWLRKVIASWQATAVSTLFLRDLKNGRADSASIVRLLAERKLLREKLVNEVYGLSSGTPVAVGIAPCILEDETSGEGILKEGADESKTALLACARLVRAPLPVAKVATLLRSTNFVLKSAAELYLESEDSAEARSIVLGIHPGEAKIVGATAYFKGLNGETAGGASISYLLAFGGTRQPDLRYDFPAYIAEELTKSERKLQKEVKDSPELLGLYSFDNNFVRIYKDKVVFSWVDDPSRYRERNLSADEFTRLKDYLMMHKVDELKPFLSCSSAAECKSSELVMLSRNGGSRVYLRSDRKPEFFHGLENMLADFRAEPSTIKYTLSKTVKGLEVLFADDDLEAQTVWKQGSDIRLVVSSKTVRSKVEEDEESEDDAASGDEDETPSPESVAKMEYVRLQRGYEGYAWRRLEGDRLGDTVAQPAGVEYFPLHDDLDVQSGAEQWKARAAGFQIRTNPAGLYKVTNGRLTKLRSGYYQNPVVSANGRWLVVSKMDEDEGPQLVRYNLVTNREFKLSNEEYHYLRAIAFVPAVGKFLLGPPDDGRDYGYSEGPDDEDEEDSVDEDETYSPDYFLLDPETGRISPPPGEARPLGVQTFRSLQSTGRPNEFWAARPGRVQSETLVGKYDSRLFRFTPVLTLPKIAFDSMEMWVDDAENKVYFVYNGQLLSIPLKNSRSS